MPKQYPKEQRDRAVRMLLDRLDDYPSMYAACNAIAPKLGIGPETLRRWTLQVQIDTGGRHGPTSDERAEIKTLKSKVRDLEEANEILKQASMPRCEGARPSPPLICEFIDAMRAQGFAGRVRSAQSRVSRAARSPHEPTKHGKNPSRLTEPSPTRT